jgi:hypothetical protein
MSNLKCKSIEVLQENGSLLSSADGGGTVNHDDEYLLKVLPIFT